MCSLQDGFPSHSLLASTSDALFRMFAPIRFTSFATRTTHALCQRSICHVQGAVQPLRFAHQTPPPRSWTSWHLSLLPRVYDRVNRRSTHVFAHGDARIGGVHFRHVARLCVAKRATRVQNRSRGARCAPKEVRHADVRRRRRARKPKHVHGVANGD